MSQISPPSEPPTIQRSEADQQNSTEADNDNDEGQDQERASEQGNSLGGSQYESEDDFDEHKVDQENDDPQEEEPIASEEEEPEVCMTSMHTLWMQAMCRITEPHPKILEPYIKDIEDIVSDRHVPLSSNEATSYIRVTPIELAGEQPDNSLASAINKLETSSSSWFRNELPVVHSYLYNSEAKISDPVFIEYRDRLIFREELGQDMDLFLEAAQWNNCCLCNNCHLLVKIHWFMGSNKVYWYYYYRYTCQTPVERNQVREEISDDEDLNVEMFFSTHIVWSPDPSFQEDEEMVTADKLSRWEESVDDNILDSPDVIPALVDVVIESESVGYIDDPPKRSNWTFSTTAGSLWDIPEGTEISLADITCNVCHECSPMIVAIYHKFGHGTHFVWFQQLCHSADMWHSTMTMMHSPPADPMTNSLAIMEDKDHDKAEGMPELVTIPDDEDSLVDAETVRETCPDDTSLSNDSEEDSSNLVKVPDCPYCHDCEPRTEHAYYFRSDGKVFYQDRLVCQDPGDNQVPTRSSMCAMWMVHSSTVHCKTLMNSDQPICSFKLQATLVAEVEINGMRALTLFDSESTIDSIMPKFAFVIKAQQIRLEEQVVLQLRCIESWLKISYRTIDFGGVKDKLYFDLVNINQYDCIIGTSFMNMYSVCLNFSTHTIRMNRM